MEAPDGGDDQRRGGALSLLSEEKLEEDEADVAEPWRDGHHQHTGRRVGSISPFSGAHTTDVRRHRFAPLFKLIFT
jgi:hypothetical protein